MLTYSCGMKGCRQVLLQLRSDGELVVTTRHESTGSPAADYHHDLALDRARATGENVARWLEAKWFSRLADSPSVNVWCPFHGRWSVDSSAIASVLAEELANGRSTVKLKGTADELKVRTSHGYRTVVPEPPKLH